MNRVAIYLRLSREDENKENAESESIQNQRSMLVSYANEKDWQITKIYSDEDYSGSDESRPAFNEMLIAAENREFDILLCKSLSRFARDVSMVETYINGKFLDWGIRFIAPTDYADTGAKGNRKNIQINSLVNQWYLEDLSENIKSVLKHKKEQGQFLAPVPPYGYIKDPNDKHKLLKDENVADVVEKIFELALKEHTASSIVQYLNNQGIENPSTYFYSRGWYHNKKARHTRWIVSTVKHLLHSEVYTGDLVQNKFGNKTYKSKRATARPKDEWIVVKNTHEPYITHDEYKKIQKLLSSRTKFYSGHKKGNTNYYRGMIFCGECGGSLTGHSGGGSSNLFFRCSGAETGATMCKGTRISKDWLDKVLIDKINEEISQIQHKTPKSVKIYTKEKDNYEKTISNLNANLEKYNNALSIAYLEKAENKITPEEYNIVRSGILKQIEDTKRQLERAEESLSDIKAQQNQATDFFEFIKNHSQITELTREVITAFVNKITVNKRKSRKLFDYDVDIVMKI